MPEIPPIDPAANGLRVVLTTDAGAVLADLTAPAGVGWRVNRPGTTCTYRDPSASTGIVNARVRAVKPAGTWRVQITARGLALDAAPAGMPLRASVALGAPNAAPGQCGVTAFTDCRTPRSRATVRCR